jgi:hypothetical protein
MSDGDMEGDDEGALDGCGNNICVLSGCSPGAGVGLEVGLLVGLIVGRGVGIGVRRDGIWIVGLTVGIGKVPSRFDGLGEGAEVTRPNGLREGAEVTRWSRPWHG